MATNDEIEYESWQFQRMRELADLIAEECPWMWRIGDGNGGAVLNEVKAAYARRGFDITSDTNGVEGKRKSIPIKLRAEVFRRDNHTCLKCGAEDGLSIDHILPVSRGGQNTIDNLQTLCMPCNISKGVATISYLSETA